MSTQYRKGNIEASGDVTAYSTYTPSDVRLKTNIEPITVDLNKFNNVKSVTYNWIEEIERPNREYGFIAQEMRENFPMLVVEKKFEGRDTLIVDYQKAVVVLWGVVQQQEARIKELEAKLN